MLGKSYEFQIVPFVGRLKRRLKYFSKTPSFLSPSLTEGQTSRLQSLPFTTSTRNNFSAQTTNKTFFIMHNNFYTENLLREPKKLNKRTFVVPVEMKIKRKSENFISVS